MSFSLATVVIGSQIPAQALTFNGSNALDFDRLNVELETRNTTMLGDGPLESQQYSPPGGGRPGGGSSGSGSGSNDRNGGG